MKIATHRMDLLLIIGYINKTPQKFLFWDIDVHPVTLKTC